MFNKGQFELKPMGLLLAIIGGGIAFFTVSGGFSSWPPGQEPGLFVVLGSTLGAALIGFIWGNSMGD